MAGLSVRKDYKDAVERHYKTLDGAGDILKKVAAGAEFEELETGAEDALRGGERREIHYVKLKNGEEKIRIEVYYLS
jgi:hypothetical protein